MRVSNSKSRELFTTARAGMPGNAIADSGCPQRTLHKQVTTVPLQRRFLLAILAGRAESGLPSPALTVLRHTTLLKSAALKLQDMCGSVLPRWAPRLLHRHRLLGTTGSGFPSTEGGCHHLSLLPVQLLASHLLGDELPLQFLRSSQHRLGPCR